MFFRLVVRRYVRASMIVASNKSFLDWGEIFNDYVLVTAVSQKLQLKRFIFGCTYVKAKYISLAGLAHTDVDHNGLADNAMILAHLKIECIKPEVGKGISFSSRWTFDSRHGLLSTRVISARSAIVG